LYSGTLKFTRDLFQTRKPYLHLLKLQPTTHLVLSLQNLVPFIFQNSAQVHFHWRLSMSRLCFLKELSSFIFTFSKFFCEKRRRNQIDLTLACLLVVFEASKKGWMSYVKIRIDTWIVQKPLINVFKSGNPTYLTAILQVLTI
jgi:hypothetical protein